MNVSVSVLPLLLFLAPGLGALLGITAGSLRSAIRQSPPTLGGFIPLVVIIFGSLVAHLIGLALSTANALACSTGCLIPVDVAPNLYRAAIAWAARGNAPTDATILAILGYLAFLSAGALTAAALYTRRVSQHPRIAYIFYGWLAAHSAPNTPSSALVLAVIRLRANGDEPPARVEGLVVEISTGNDRQLVSITLNDAEFDTPYSDTDPMPERFRTWHVDANQIAHLSLNNYPITGIA